MKVMYGTVLEKARLYFILEHKVRVSIINLPKFCLVFSLCFRILFSFHSLFKDFLSPCCRIMLMHVNVFLLFRSSLYSAVYISLGFDHRRRAQRNTRFWNKYFSFMHNVDTSDKLLQSHPF